MAFDSHDELAGGVRVAGRLDRGSGCGTKHT
jgi:hypothetical protein